MYFPFFRPSLESQLANLPPLQCKQLEPLEIIQVGDVENFQTKLRFVCISDTHLLHKHLKMPQGDVLIHSGDFSKRKKNKMEILKEFNDWLGTLNYKHKILICGNHETSMPNDPSETRKILTNCTYLQDEMITIEGINIYGSPWHNKRAFWYRANAFGISESSIIQKWKSIPEETDILITHVPIRGVNDLNHKGFHMGDKYLLNETLYRIKPKVHVFGHCHEGWGAQKIKEKNGDHSIYCINAAQESALQPIVFDYHI